MRVTVDVADGTVAVDLKVDMPTASLVSASPVVGIVAPGAKAAQPAGISVPGAVLEKVLPLYACTSELAWSANTVVVIRTV